MPVVRCRDCLSKTKIAHPEAPAVMVCEDCQRRALTRIFSREVTDADISLIKQARRNATNLFVRFAAQRRVDCDGLLQITSCLSAVDNDQVELLEPQIRKQFGLTYNELFERLTDAISEAISGTPPDHRYRVEWFAPAILPFYDCWRGLGFDPKVRIADAEPVADEITDGANTPFADFLIFQLGLIEQQNARGLASAASVKKLDQCVRSKAAERSLSSSPTSAAASAEPANS